jgi:hypothetical protein
VREAEEYPPSEAVTRERLMIKLSGKGLADIVMIVNCGD